MTFPSPNKRRKNYNFLCNFENHDDDLPFSKVIERLRLADGLRVTNQNFTSNELECDRIFLETCKRNREGKFIARLPFKVSLTQLRESKARALRRFYHTERGLTLNEDLRKQYTEEIICVRPFQKGPLCRFYNLPKIMFAIF